MKISRYLILITLISGIFAQSLEAQDIHFSQFYASPLTLNPSLAGFHDGSYRVTAIYRNQWRSVTTPYQTFGASYDMRLLQDKIKDVFGVGGSLAFDKAGDGNLGLLGIMASVSYHKMLKKDGRHYIGLGLQLGYVQRSLDYNKLTFPSQYSNGDFDLTFSNGENFSDGNVKYFDMNAGILWNSKFGKRIGIFAGGTVFHITQPKESFLGRNERLNMRYLAHGGMNINVTKNIYITPNIIFMHQNKAQELNFGAAFEYHFNDDGNTIVSLGGWYRLDDAPIISASVEYKNVRTGVAYDVNTSALDPASHHRGAFEVSLIYIGKIKGEAPILVPCPRL